MLEYIMGWIIGINSKKKIIEPLDNNIDILPKEEVIEKPKVIKYVLIPELNDLPTTLEESYIDYKENNLVCIYSQGHIYYYLEVEVNEDEIMWGREELLNYI